MMMTPSIRKLALTAHVTTSVGWLGAGKTPFGRDTQPGEIGETSPDGPLIAKRWLRVTVLGLITLLLLFLIVHLMTRGGH